MEGETNRLRFKQIQQEDIYFKEYLTDEFRQSRFAMPENIRQARNLAIIMGFIEILCCIASIALYLRERSRVVLALIVLTFIVSLWGTYSKIRLSYWGLLSHAVFTISIIGGFFIYTVIQCFLEQGKD